MKTLKSILIPLALAVTAFGQQNVMTQTSTSAAMTASQNTVVVASATNIAVNTTNLYIVDPGQTVGELVRVNSISGTTIGVTRGVAGKNGGHTSGAMVLVGSNQWFNSVDPAGNCVTASTYVRPWVNVANGAQWLCSTVTLSWVPGWNNTLAPAGATATVASAAGTITPSGPLFSVSGTAAITGFVVPVGFKSGSFSIIPTGNFTWTTAGNIGLAGTAVTGRVLTFTWDASSSKFLPSYV